VQPAGSILLAAGLSDGSQIMRGESCRKVGKSSTRVGSRHTRVEYKQKALKQPTADSRSSRTRTQQYLETVLGLFWRFATSFSAQASLLRRLSSIIVSRLSFAAEILALLVQQPFLARLPA
jgi:hypothetical protein